MLGKRWAFGIAALCVFVAVARVGILGTAFPFFHPVDEHFHYDAVLKYSRGELPDGNRPTLERRTARLILSHFSFEYLRSPDSYPNGRFPPPYLDRKPHLRSGDLPSEMAKITAEVSTEFESPPTYYALAGAWLWLAEALELEPLTQLYWLRWFNVLVVAALVWGTYYGLRRLFPDDPFVYLGTPALLAVFPMDSFYGISNDPLSTVLGGCAFLVALRMWRGPVGSGLAALGGLAAALAFLNKYSNVALLLLAAIVFVRACRRWRLEETAQAPLARLAPSARRALGVYAASVTLPVAAWLVRNMLVLGSLTGTRHKTEHLGWVPKQPAEWTDHPLFTLAGAWTFLSRIPGNYWQGELPWHGRAMTWPWLTWTYIVASALALAAALAIAASRSTEGGSAERRIASRLALLVIGSSVATLGALSLLFQFPPGGAPKPELPYFVQGRLISGTLVAFALTFVWTVGATRRVWGERGAVLLLAGWIVLVSVSEIVLHAPVFDSRWNGFDRLGAVGAPK